jgi:hypothetical protein
MKRKTSLISITQEEMKQTLAGGDSESFSQGGSFVDTYVHPPVPVCSAYCLCTCTWDTVYYIYNYTGYNNMMLNKNGAYPG